MMKKQILSAILTSFLINLSAFAALEIGKVPPALLLQGKEGARVNNGESWSSEELKGKVHILMYVDPDKKDINVHVEKALKDQQFPRDKFESVAVINMAATWLPNAIIASKLEEKQKLYPDTVYVKDFKKMLVKGWEVEDDDYVILAFNREGLLTFHKAGKFSDEDTNELIENIKKNLK